MKPRVHALVPAAGSGKRFGSERPKVLLDVAGRPAICHTIERLLAVGLERLWLALPSEWVSEGRDLVLATDPGIEEKVQVIAGGRDRQESVELCLAASAEDSSDAFRDLVLVHDGARPAVHPEDVERLIEAAQREGAAILGRRVTDTLKRLTRDPPPGSWVEATVDRTELFRAETPQIARRSLLKRALEVARDRGVRGTDESSLLEACQIPVLAVEARHPNPKLTYPGDLVVIETLLSEPRSRDPATAGTGGRI